MHEFLSFLEFLVDDSLFAIKVNRPILSGLNLFLAARGAGRLSPSAWCKAILFRNRSTLNRLNQAMILQKFSVRILPPVVDFAVVDAMIGIPLFMRAFSVMFEMIVEFAERSSLNVPGPLLHARMCGLAEDCQPTWTSVTSSMREVTVMNNLTSRCLSCPFISMPCRLRHRQ